MKVLKTHKLKKYKGQLNTNILNVKSVKEKGG